MIRRVSKSLVAVVILVAASARADEAACITARYIAAIKYATCGATVAAKGVDNQAFLKCEKTYAAAWPKLNAKYPGTSCAGARFVDNGLTITDNLTQLVWEKKTTAKFSGPNPADPHDVDNYHSWSYLGTPADGTVFTDYLQVVNAAGFAGQHDWRLPTLFELQTLIVMDASGQFTCNLNNQVESCVTDPLLLPMQADYWSSTPNPTDPNNLLGVSFQGGWVSNLPKVESHYVRAVRGGF